MIYQVRDGRSSSDYTDTELHVLAKRGAFREGATARCLDQPARPVLIMEGGCWVEYEHSVTGRREREERERAEHAAEYDEDEA